MNFSSAYLRQLLMFEQNVKEPSESFFWPAAYLQKSEPDDEEEAEEDDQSEDDPLTVIFRFKFTFNF